MSSIALFVLNFWKLKNDGVGSIEKQQILFRMMDSPAAAPRQAMAGPATGPGRRLSWLPG